MKWTDIIEIAIALEENHPDEDIINIRFTDLHNLVTELDDFIDVPEKSNEKILEAIQAAWLDEREE